MNIQKIVLLEDVANDLKIAEHFYEKQNKGLGAYFRDSIIADIESLWLYGGIHAKIFGLHRLFAKRFPYAIYYSINQGDVVIVAVLDLRQNPKHIEEFLDSRFI